MTPVSETSHIPLCATRALNEVLLSVFVTSQTCRVGQRRFLTYTRTAMIGSTTCTHLTLVSWFVSTYAESIRYYESNYWLLYDATNSSMQLTLALVSSRADRARQQALTSLFFTAATRIQRISCFCGCTRLHGACFNNESMAASSIVPCLRPCARSPSAAAE